MRNISYYLGDGVQATTVGFNYLLSGIAIDATGNLLIADGGSYAIRKVAVNGIISTIAGNGTNEYSGDGGPASEAGLAGPAAPVVSNNGALFFADNNRIRKITGLVSLPTISLGTSPTICNGASSFVLSYSATSGSPNQYTISGAGVVPGQTGTLTGTSGTIAVGIYTTFTGSYSLVVANTTTNLVSNPVIGTVLVDKPAIAVTGNQTFCPGRSTVLTVVGGIPQGGIAQVWSTGEVTPSISVSSTGFYSVTVTSATGCKSLTFVNVTQLPAPTAIITYTQSACSDVVTTLTATGGTSQTWSTGATTPSISVPNTGTYSLTVTNANGCTGSTSTTLGTHPDYAALADLYNATNGANWTNKTKWLTNCNPCSGWYGVNCTEGRVTWLALAANNLAGTIPASLSTLTSLTSLNLNQNELSGTIPSGLGSMTQLQALFLQQNQLSGTIPNSFSALTNVQYFFLGNNQLTGIIPASLSALRSVQSIDLGSNQLSGTVPASLSALTNLRNVSLGINLLSGFVPDGFGAISNLESIDLSNNKLTGTIPNSLSALTKLNYLALNGNQLSGTIPTSFTGLTNLYTLKLSNNQLSGAIPNLYSSRELDVSYNQLTGTIPANLPNLDRLQILRFNNNQLSGSIPESFSSLRSFGTPPLLLDLSTNQLTGCFPASMGLPNCWTGFWRFQTCGLKPENCTSPLPSPPLSYHTAGV